MNGAQATSTNKAQYNPTLHLEREAMSFHDFLYCMLNLMKFKHNAIVARCYLSIRFQQEKHVTLRCNKTET